MLIREYTDRIVQQDVVLDGQRIDEADVIAVIDKVHKTYIVYEDYMNLHPHAVLIRVLWRWYQKNIGL